MAKTQAAAEGKDKAKPKKPKSLTVAMTGASGMVGTAAGRRLELAGHAMRPVARRELWDFDLASIDKADAVVHLAGENIAARRWSKAQKDRIRESRASGTRQVAAWAARRDKPPSVLVCASAVGYYGDRGDEELTEESAAGEGFLAEVCRAWEEAADPARRAGIRVVHLRFGVVLSPKGGALKKMLLPFKLGAGGKLGSGRQYMSWITLDDAAAAIEHALLEEELEGPVNAVAPNPVTNAEYTKALGAALNRPTVFPMPGFVARLAFGEMANELLLAGQRAVPSRLASSGFEFRDPEIGPALQRLLG